MIYALRKKFAHPKLKEILLETKKRELIENSPYDKYWGIAKITEIGQKISMFIEFTGTQAGKALHYNV